MPRFAWVWVADVQKFKFLVFFLASLGIFPGEDIIALLGAMLDLLRPRRIFSSRQISDKPFSTNAGAQRSLKEVQMADFWVF